MFKIQCNFFIIKKSLEIYRIEIGSKYRISETAYRSWSFTICWLWVSLLFEYGPINFSIKSHSYDMDQRRQKRGTTKVRVARAREIQRPVAAADFIRDRLLGMKLKVKKVFWGFESTTLMMNVAERVANALAICNRLLDHQTLAIKI